MITFTEHPARYDSDLAYCTRSAPFHSQAEMEDHEYVVGDKVEGQRVTEQCQSLRSHRWHAGHLMRRPQCAAVIVIRCVVVVTGDLMPESQPLVSLRFH